MSQIIKAFTGIYMVLLLMAVGTGILGAFLQTMQAQNLHGRVIDELENSDYASPVIEEAFRSAEQQNVELQLHLYLEDGSVVLCKKAETLPEDTIVIEMAEVILSYSVRLPFVGKISECYVAGYAH